MVANIWQNIENYGFLVIIFKFLLSISLARTVKSNHIYDVIIDSGSTGSRAYIYRHHTASPLATLEEISHLRVHPALASLYNNDEGLCDHVHSLLTFASNNVPSEYHSFTKISLKATAGMRTIVPEAQEWIMSRVRNILGNTSFQFDPHETRILSGGEEALFALLATNIAFANISSRHGLTLGAADLGGSSKQVAFMLPMRAAVQDATEYLSSDFNKIGIGLDKLEAMDGITRSWIPPEFQQDQCRADYRLSIPGSSMTFDIFARSIPGLGLVAAMNETFYAIRNAHNEKQTRTTQSYDSNIVSIDYDGKLTNASIHLYFDNSSCSSNCYEASSFESDAAVMAAAEAVAEMTEFVVDIETEITMESMVEIAEEMVNDLEDSAVDSDQKVINPCAPPGETLVYDTGIADLPWIGTGDFFSCVDAISQILKEKADKEIKCLRNSKAPPLIAMDNFPKVLEVMKLPVDAPLSPAAIKAAGIEVCRRPWREILEEFPDFLPYRAQHVCFGASFIYTVTTELYGLEHEDETTFLPTDSHHSFTISWSLGAALISAVNLTYEAIEENLL